MSFGNAIRADIHEKVMSAYNVLQSKRFPFISDLVPGYCTLGVIYNIVKAGELPGNGSIYSRVVGALNEELTVMHNRKLVDKRQLRVPVCYDEEFAPDLEALAITKQLSQEEFISLHSSVTYDVYMLGFLPGFAYMGVVDDRIAAPRLQTPRTHVPEGSVGIAGNQTGIYPSDSPGGWQLIGRTPIALFNPDSNSPAFFRAGDQVTFYPITKHEFENY